MSVERQQCGAVVGTRRVAAILSILATGGALACSSGPGRFGLEIDPSEITLPSASVDQDGNVILEEQTVNVLLDCLGNSEFFLSLVVDGVPDEVDVTLPPGSQGTPVCGSIEPLPAPMLVVVAQANPGTYELTVTGTNYARNDILLTEPKFQVSATLTLIISLPVQ